MSGPEHKTILVIGLGMIGGSVARALRSRNPGQKILAVDADQEQLTLALEAGVIDQGSCVLGELAAAAELVIIAVPTLSAERVMSQLAGRLDAAAVITDVASVKGAVVDAAKRTLGSTVSRFVPAHPIAGSEKSGFRAASENLFQSRRVIVTPDPSADVGAVNLVHGLWRWLGADVIGMTVDRHDQVLAATSHLPHLLSYALVDSLVRNRDSRDIFRYAAGGFADFSRLASSDPIMWADIFVANDSATIRVLDSFMENLRQLRELLERRGRAELLEVFGNAKSARDGFIRKLQNPAGGSVTEQQRQIDYQALPGGAVAGEIRVPGDKSISHRAIIFASLAQGASHVTGFLEGEDALNTLEAFREMGVTIVGPDAGELTIYGVGMGGLKPPRKPLYMGNSGTAMRLLAGLLAAQDFTVELTGDESLSRRPMKRVADPLRQMGARIETSAGGTPPLRIAGTRLRGIEYRMPMASAQVKSSLLLAGMYAEGKTCVSEPEVCRDHTERMLEGFGYPLRRDAASRRVCIEGGHLLLASNIDIPGDISSAAFFLVAAAITPGARLVIRHVGINPTRTGIITLLQLMGADLTLDNQRLVGGEPVADITIAYAPLHGIDIPAAQIPLAIDEFPALFIAAACAEGTTRLRGAEELRVKESDRLQAMANGLATLGVSHILYPDGIDITGGAMDGGEIDSAGDHRIAMAFTVAALRSRSPIWILDCANVATSFPGFLELATRVGMRAAVVDPAPERK